MQPRGRPRPSTATRCSSRYLEAFAGVARRPGRDRGAYRDRLATLGRRVRVEQVGGGALVGEATAVADDGALVVRDDAGSEHTVTVGDVVHLRPA